ncbi:SSU ribosomal protein S4e [Candidatus Methanomethylophilus alvi Mx1201]|uniref:Small ribosomal subunit protein eS4 n=3 Tax=Methanomethylophilus alvi TaxID=1291540 RepID=M9SFE1_METAX|nr:30S ribosomal protein S4e [Methanomethylophilus alvi]CDF30283.1 30S ribosomal protein S4e [Methanoculleus sp. CAG:1088]AGI86140.1 SSU ribosomal protein S4e [Candidatus Methanomethylophilus alvi Mx1201]AYQ55511.1 30S ribosomal protein S4e [Methanomethylophilus alvi]MCI5974351.1 30S ribosomal protein S4e [Methanomethylophilus alvi]MDD7480182.1 30S ribosomal protein S4e [Methanomethylophilus alvi]
MSDHMKRLAMPRTWAIPRKVHVWAAKQTPGAHSVEDSMPAGMVLRDMLKVCDTAREAKKIIANRDMIVNGRKVKDAKAPVGIMDSIAIPKMNLYYRMLLTGKGKLTVVAIPEEEAKWVLCRVENKTKVAGGKLQLNLSGGRNIILDANQYKTGDSVKLDLEKNEIVGSYPLAENATVLVINGRHAGKVEDVESISAGSASAPSIITFKNKSETVKENVFVIGTGKSEITLPEASE